MEEGVDYSTRVVCVVSAPTQQLSTSHVQTSSPADA